MSSSSRHLYNLAPYDTFYAARAKISLVLPEVASTIAYLVVFCAIWTAIFYLALR